MYLNWKTSISFTYDSGGYFQYNSLTAQFVITSVRSMNVICERAAPDWKTRGHHISLPAGSYIQKIIISSTIVRLYFSII